MTRILLSGYYGFDNWGDEAILETAAKGLAETLPEAEITVLSADPPRTEARYGLRAVRRTNLRVLLKELRRADLLISGGGSLLQDATSSRSLWYYLAIIGAARSLGKKVMLYANGIGPIRRPANRILTRRVLNAVPLITVRGPSSLACLAELGVTRPRIVETADTAFSVDPAGGERVQAICRRENLPDLTDTGDRPFVGLVLRPWPGTSALPETMVHLADHIAGRLAYRVLFLPVHRAVDLPVVERVMAGMKHESHLLRGLYSASETVGLLSRLRWVISMRLHPLIFAAVGGVPTIGLAYDPKVDEFLEQTKQLSVGPIEKVSLEDMLQAVAVIERDYDARSARLGETVAELRRRAGINNTLAAELVAGR